MKNIISIAWAVIIALYSWLSAIYWTPGPLNSNLIRTEKAVPNNPENKANIKYNVPISLALEDKNHLSVHREIFPQIGEASWSKSLDSLLISVFVLSNDLGCLKALRWESGKDKPPYSITHITFLCVVIGRII
jgi:hypothetical protein